MAATSRDPIERDFAVFVHDGDVQIGSVRELERHKLVIYVENAGEFEVPLSAVKEVGADKIVLDCAKLDMKLKRAIGHAHDAEDPDVARGPR